MVIEDSSEVDMVDGCCEGYSKKSSCSLPSDLRQRAQWFKVDFRTMCISRDKISHDCSFSYNSMGCGKGGGEGFRRMKGLSHFSQKFSFDFFYSENSSDLLPVLMVVFNGTRKRKDGIEKTSQYRDILNTSWPRGSSPSPQSIVYR